MSKKIILFSAGVFILAIGGIYVAHKKTVPIENQSVSYSCSDKKTITATYGEKSVAIKLSDGRSFVLPQQISGSGIRYETDGIAFLSKGPNAFLIEQGQQTYMNCVEGTNVPNGDANTFTDAGKTFSFSYPKVTTISGGDIGYTQSWSNNQITLGLELAKLEIPRESQPKTNFSGATLSVGTSSDVDAVKSCVATGTSVSINGADFTKSTSSDAGAGNFYETTMYRIFRNSQCYNLEYTIHTTNIGNYSPDQGIVEYDKSSVTQTLESIVQSFKFL
jgi:membrane-bound inhibitor of C-type lysozyme